MATQKKVNGSSGAKIQGFVKEQLEDAQKRLVAFESEAQQVLENLVERGQKSRKDLEKLLTRFNGLEQLKDLNPLDSAQVKKLGKRATVATNEVRKKLEDLQTKVVESVGVASQAQVQQINRELTKLSRKLDALAPKKAGAKTESRN